MDNPYDVDLATVDDADELLRYLIPLYSETALQPVSLTKLENLIVRCVNQDNAIAGIVRSSDRPIVASVGLLVDEHDYTDEPHLRVSWLNTHPAHRREPHGRKLIEFAKWAQEQMTAACGAPMPLFAQLLTSEDLLGQMQAYQRNMPQAGAWFAWGAAPARQFDQVSMGTGKGHLGRSTGEAARVGRIRPSPFAKAAGSTRAA